MSERGQDLVMGEDSREGGPDGGAGTVWRGEWAATTSRAQGIASRWKRHSKREARRILVSEPKPFGIYQNGPRPSQEPCAPILQQRELRLREVNCSTRAGAAPL